MKEKKNYIDNIPKINDMKWDVSEDGIVEITVGYRLQLSLLFKCLALCLQ